jgi:hypothetical protein
LKPQWCKTEKERKQRNVQIVFNVEVNREVIELYSGKLC